MGVCLSKKKKKQPSATHPPPPAPSCSPPQPVATVIPNTVAAHQKKPPAQEMPEPASTQNPKSQYQRKVSATDEATASGAASRERKPVFLVTPAKQRRPSWPPSPDPHPSDRERDGVPKHDPDEIQAQKLSQSSVAAPLPAEGRSVSADRQLPALRRDDGLLPEDPTAARVVRTSNCTTEEVESILIQCGRLSRSESTKAGESGRRYSGLKRSYDFDKDVGEEEVPVVAQQSSSSARPSPRRRAHSRERDGGGEGAGGKRSNSRERLTGGSRSRRVSRSPGRRSDTGIQLPAACSGGSASSTSNSSSSNAAVTAAASGQPGKMVSVPPREKDVSAVAAARRGGIPVSIRNSSPRRSRSPATLRHVSVSNENTAPGAHHAQHPQSLSRSSSRKGATEQSPYRRNPMAEIDDNVPRGVSDVQAHNPSQKVARTPRKAVAPSSLSQQQTHLTGQHKPHSELKVTCPQVKQQLPVSKTAEEEQLRREAEEALETAAAASITSKGPTLTRTRSSRLSSRDLDTLPLNTDGTNSNSNGCGSSYASLLLEDIQSYHQTQNQNQMQQQAAAAAVTLPACVSKACSILEAVAGLNNNSPAGSWTESNNNNRDYIPRREMGVVGLSATRKDGCGFILESEVAGRDDLLEPSMHRYVSVRDKLAELEPQESAGSNSFIPATTWAAGTGSSPGDVESSDRCWTSDRSGDSGEEVNCCRVEHREAPPNRHQPAVAAATGKQQRSGGSLLSNGSGTQSVPGRKREQQQQLAIDQQRQGRGSSGGIGRFGRATTSSVIVVSATTA